jgi:LemA protein
MIAAIVVAVVVVLLLVGAILMYNRLVRARNTVDDAWGQIDVQLKRRYDLIPNLVETVRGYAAHERATFDSVTAARSAAMAAQGPEQQAQAEQQLGGALRGLLAVAERYPELRASENFQALQGELAHTEDRIAYSRQFYNDVVLAYNNAVTTFPTNVMAGLIGYRSRPYFNADPTERSAVQVSFGS